MRTITAALDRAVDQAINEIEAAFGRPFGRRPTILPFTYEHLLTTMRTDPNIKKPARTAQRLVRCYTALYDYTSHSCFFKQYHNPDVRKKMVSHELAHAYAENEWPGINDRPRQLFKTWVHTGNTEALERSFASRVVAEGIATYVERSISARNDKNSVQRWERRFAVVLIKAWQHAGYELECALDDEQERNENEQHVPSMAKKAARAARLNVEQVLADTSYPIGYALIRRAYERTGDLYTAVDGLARSTPRTRADLRRLCA